MGKMLKIKGLKNAIGDYNRANEGGYYSPRYGYLMFDKSTGEIWTDEFYSIGHNEWKEYHSESVINVVDEMRMCGNYEKITMNSVKEFLIRNFGQEE